MTVAKYEKRNDSLNGGKKFVCIDARNKSTDDLQFDHYAKDFRNQDIEWDGKKYKN